MECMEPVINRLIYWTGFHFFDGDACALLNENTIHVTLNSNHCGDLNAFIDYGTIEMND